MKYLVVLLSLLCALVQAAPLKVGLHDSAPWAYRNAQGEITGLDYEIIKTILQREGIEAEFELYSYSRLLKLFSEKKLDMASPVAVPYPGAFYSQPYFTVLDVVVTKSSSPLSINSLKDLEGKTIVAYQQASEVLGPDFAATVKKAHYLEEADRVQQFELLMNDRVQLMIGDAKVLAYYATKHYGAKSIKSHQILPSVDYPAAFWNRGLQAKFNAGLLHLTESGEFDQIHAKPRL
ncbi:MAG: transporter substrate-binding domain-containing protein [Gammaproteobacteria bacterium]|nr:transporter substrate-binding domain-containing protein [Gammaproteobacteria bacterium]MBU2059562.1 transporter substrate-binding domain-containing protein [Gammaproteobacteria bacterium]MBU2174409.1 transporter substrate-binding domain-containing protein [Gammaproteobacteria bacterium]MBU2248034.1 transporter substrate-binding domain-containing protein [Gammaproteobacteria bacterium]MBU2345504.1 transporter substrate-binding domain-containing protein [Gammaproteobacteria bacterium]